MQALKQLSGVLADLLDGERALFSAADLAAAFPGYRQMPVLLSRAVKAGVLQRVCRGIYLNPRATYDRGRLLFHAAARLRAGEFNYISLENALSDAGLISQIPMDWITLMSSGRSHVVDCGSFGRIEFVHTAQRPGDIAGELTWDRPCRLWRASVRQAMRDLRVTRRSADLVEEQGLERMIAGKNGEGENKKTAR